MYMYKYVLNLVVQISLTFAQYFEYYAIILRVASFSWTHCITVSYVCCVKYSEVIICGVQILPCMIQTEIFDA